MIQYTGFKKIFVDDEQIKDNDNVVKHTNVNFFSENNQTISKIYLENKKIVYIDKDICDAFNKNKKFIRREQISGENRGFLSFDISTDIDRPIKKLWVIVQDTNLKIYSVRIGDGDYYTEIMSGIFQRVQIPLAAFNIPNEVYFEWNCMKNYFGIQGFDDGTGIIYVKNIKYSNNILPLRFYKDVTVKMIPHGIKVHINTYLTPEHLKIYMSNDGKNCLVKDIVATHCQEEDFTHSYMFYSIVDSQLLMVINKYDRIDIDLLFSINGIEIKTEKKNTTITQLKENNTLEFNLFNMNDLKSIPRLIYEGNMKPICIIKTLPEGYVCCQIANIPKFEKALLHFSKNNVHAYTTDVTDVYKSSNYYGHYELKTLADNSEISNVKNLLLEGDIISFRFEGFVNGVKYRYPQCVGNDDNVHIYSDPCVYLWKNDLVPEINFVQLGTSKFELSTKYVTKKVTLRYNLMSTFFTLLPFKQLRNTDSIVHIFELPANQNLDDITKIEIEVIKYNNNVIIYPYEFLTKPQTINKLIIKPSENHLGHNEVTFYSNADGDDLDKILMYVGRNDEKKEYGPFVCKSRTRAYNNTYSYNFHPIVGYLRDDDMKIRIEKIIDIDYKNKILKTKKCIETKKKYFEIPFKNYLHPLCAVGGDDTDIIIFWKSHIKHHVDSKLRIHFMKEDGTEIIKTMKNVNIDNDIIYLDNQEKNDKEHGIIYSSSIDVDKIDTNILFCYITYTSEQNKTEKYPQNTMFFPGINCKTFDDRIIDLSPKLSVKFKQNERSINGDQILSKDHVVSRIFLEDDAVFSLNENKVFITTNTEITKNAYCLSLNLSGLFFDEFDIELNYVKIHVKFVDEKCKRAHIMCVDDGGEFILQTENTYKYMTFEIPKSNLIKLIGKDIDTGKPVKIIIDSIVLTNTAKSFFDV